MNNMSIDISHTLSLLQSIFMLDLDDVLFRYTLIQPLCLILLNPLNFIVFFRMTYNVFFMLLTLTNIINISLRIALVLKFILIMLAPFLLLFKDISIEKCVLCQNPTEILYIYLFVKYCGLMVCKKDIYYKVGLK